MPRSVLTLVLCLVVLAAGAGLYFGLQHARLDESDVIEAVVGRYVRETGGARTDCVAVPGDEPDVWLVVNCGTAARISRYKVGHDGQLIAQGTEPST
ncbi:hypothetical protein [Sulfitobacter sabulilitoris]|uniref:Uncharacterized protein n=1 Tax=Sulfitobacter sabulilitoris TaxID=2562655 RepID=A0A5S3PKW2_9RHOB|nr:hypothetical protein [Sulfitobacter sabulilitoris]TMM54961.1 hypothetical protein FDT80_05125 [Sulfitobacter sabulilitoris]